MQMKKIFSIVFAALLCSFAASAQADVMGSSLVVKDPVASAMAGTSLAGTSNVAFSAFGNAASTVFFDKKMDLTASYLSWMPSASNKSMGMNLGAALKLGRRVGLSLAGNYNMGSAYEIVDDYGNRNGSFKTSSMNFGLGFGVKIIDCLGIGANVRYMSESLAADYKPWAVAADAYLMFRMKGFAATAGVSQLGSKVKDSAGKEFALPASARLGLGYSNTFGSKHFVEALLDADYFFSGAFSAAAGAQYGFNDMVFVRAGYRYGAKTAIPSYASVGLGVKFFGVKLDFAYLLGNDALKNSFCVGLGYRF